ncbi:hypothetical protein Nepgr_004996 [Nepenthes gracilis]|uniref:Uncharacterized protein n=1 Tax=Nepenthes gracilis TaxID=150966 RepID=A0AAD3S2D6_NEPGR|nr:hypothetical protein Nepgr_004996 [Nepenthes gracilis]
MQCSSLSAVFICPNRTTKNFLTRKRHQSNSFISSPFRSLNLRIRYPIHCSRHSNHADGISFRVFWNWLWIEFFYGAKRWASWIISIYMFTLTLGAKAHGNPPHSVIHACEHVHNYYVSAEHLNGEALRKELNSLIAGHHSLSYRESKSRSGMPLDFLMLLMLIDQKLHPGWEHLWPRSYGLTHGPSLTDLHNIRPADVNVNSSRGNKYFGECPVGSADCLRPSNKEAAPDTEADAKRWAPPMQVRGDIARALMYMAVRYGVHQPSGGPVLSLSDSPSMEKREMGLLSTLLKWNKIDPPSREEKLRNERICRLYQHNRNPFVDHPEYANLIWKTSISD